MASKRFNLRIFIALTLLVVAGVVMGYYRHSVFVYILAGVMIIGCYWTVFNLFGQSHRELKFFIKAIKNNDSALKFVDHTGSKSLNRLHEAFNELNHLIQQAKIDNRIHENYFKNIIDQLDTGILVFNDKGFVKETNAAMMRLTGLSVLTHLSQLGRVDVSFANKLRELKPGVSNLVTLTINGKNIELAGRCKQLVAPTETLILVTLHDIRSELDMKEIDAWMRLIRVLNHEMMNSLTPVVSITQSLQSMWYDADSRPAGVTRQTTIDGLNTIEERGRALMRFVQSFRSLTHIPTPEKKVVASDDFCARLNILLSPYRDQPNLTLSIVPPQPPLELLMDEQLIIQVLMNLVKNAADATCDTPHAAIELTVRQRNNHVQIVVHDNGPGIPADMLNDIFVPFFTTKPNGSGIGLSVSKQIIRAHGGNIAVDSTPGSTVFVLDWV
jgi:signal transduction histidine kinase